MKSKVHVPKWVKTAVALVIVFLLGGFMYFTQSHDDIVQVCGKHVADDGRLVIDSSIGELTIRGAVLGTPIDAQALYDNAEPGTTYQATTYGFALYPGAPRGFVSLMSESSDTPVGRCAT